MTDRLFFIENLMLWFAGHHRPMPWKGEKNPYLVWLSEIILQQTRVEQGLPYFKKFRQAYPTVQHLADASADEVMKLWEGLGYYSRARNLHGTAQLITRELSGIFPADFEKIRALKGIGDYTAAAIASFAYDLPHAVVDGNVYRVLSRFFGIETPVDSTMGKKQFATLAQEVLELAVRSEQSLVGSHKSRNLHRPPSTVHRSPSTVLPSAYNQAIMDFGATQCTPLPKCGTCPLQPQCVAFQQKKVSLLPVKSKKQVRRQRFFNYLIVNQSGAVFIKKRMEKDIWQELYEFPLIETEALPVDRARVMNDVLWQAWFQRTALQVQQVSPPLRQQLTHREVVAVFWELGVGADFMPLDDTWLKIPRENLKNFAFPKVIDTYFRHKVLPLELF